ncbi:MAG: putative Ig domain-containing protein [Oscillospiraceae bacterium]|nr:putative Ig domain-containing protein [Oscillospiraceae bacterium]
MKLWNKILSVLLALVMLLGVLPAGVLAAEAETVITLDFSADAAKGKAVTAFTEAEDGWAYDTAASSNVTPIFYKNANWDYSCLRFTQNVAGGVGALSFTAPVSGTYTMELTYCVGNNGNNVDMTVGGQTASYFAWANWGTAPKTVTLDNVKLTAGSNPMRFTTPETLTATSLIMVKQVVFTLVEEAAEEDSSVVTLDFSADAGKGKAVTEFTVENDGWAMNTEESFDVSPQFYKHANWADYSCLRFTQTAAGGTGVIDFNIPEDGTYRMELTYCRGNSATSTDVTVGGTTTSFFAWANWGAEPVTVTTHDLRLTEGINSLSICTAESVTVAQYLLLKKIVFTKTDEIAPEPKTQLDVSGMSWTVPAGSDAMYDGTEKEAVLSGTLPEGVEVTLSGNTATEVGTYTAKAEFSLAEGYSEDKYEIVGTNPLTAQWSITGVPESGLVIDLHAVANQEGELSAYGVTGNDVSSLGWGVNTTETVPGGNAGQTFKWHFVKANLSTTPTLSDGSYAGVYFYSTPSGIGLTFNFYVPEDGYYRPNISLVSNTRCGGGAAWVDGVFVGDFKGYGTDAPVITTHDMNTVYLTKGVHKLLMRPTTVSEKYANYYWMYLNRIEFVEEEGPQEVRDLELVPKKENIHIEDSVSYTINVTDEAGRKIYLGEHRDGTLNWSVTSSDPETLKVEDGRLYALKEGTADITVTVTLPESENSSTKTITVQGEPQAADFEICFDEDARGDKKLGEFTLDDDGWRFVEGSGVWLSSWANEITLHGKYLGIVCKQMIDAEKLMSFEIKAPATGNYRIDIHHILRSVCGTASVYLDGEYIGEYNGNGTDWEFDQDSLTTVHLERNQVYRLTFRGHINVGADNTYMFINRIRFVVDDTQVVPVEQVMLNPRRASMAVGESCGYTFSVMDAQNNRLPVDQPLDGYTSKYFTVVSSEPDVIAVEKDKLIALSPGTSDITVTVTYGGATKSVTKTVEVNTDVLDKVSFYLPLDKMIVGESLQAGVSAKTNSGRELEHEHLTINYATADENVATIDETGMVTAVGEGTVELTVTVSMAGVTQTATITATVEPKQGHLTVTSSEGAMTMRPDDADGITLIVEGVDAQDEPMDLTSAIITFESSDTGIVQVTQEGVVTPVALGSASVLVHVVLADGTEYDATVWISVNQGKIGSTYYTQEKRDAAVYNALHYNWAYDKLVEATNAADEVLANLDAYYDAIPFEGIPRADVVGMNEDPMNHSCPICLEDLTVKYGNYPWVSDPIADPWKISCPNCKSRFPSNDFESYYKSGLDARGVFHAENADPQYLVNELYPERGAGWGVDDGWGWVTGETYTNRAGGQSPRIYAFIAGYNATLWTGVGGSKNSLRSALKNVMNAYLYSGDIKYGRAGAILIDRIADIYPTMCLTDHVYFKPRNNISSLTVATLPEGTRAYGNNDGTYYQGKILGCISESNFLAQDFLRAYDAFYPAFDDPEVLEYLSQRAEEQGLVVNGENPKDTPQELRENGIYGIVHEVSEGVRNRDIWGNFGLAQASMAMAAIVLDSTEQLSEPVEEPLNLPTGDRRLMNTDEMIAWLFEDGPHAQKNMFNKVITSISRDGHGDEVSPSYHYSWLQNLINFADVMSDYEAYPAANLYQNPRFIKMLTGALALTAGGNTTLQNGDSGSAGGIRIYLDQNAIVRAYQATGKPELAQALYFLNGETTDGLVGDMFDPDAGSLESKVMSVINEYGAYDVNKSVLLAGYGQALLKYGNPIEANQGLYGMWFGRIAGGHGNKNALDLSIFAYDLNFAPALGYPRSATNTVVRNVWERGTISRNTVIIDDESQTNYTYLTQYPNSEPYHFDDAGRVKVMDAEAAEAYSGLADQYRRTIVSVQGDDDAYYAVDFFHVIGGSTHLYSFHAAAEDYPISDSLELVAREGTYAGEDVPYGTDVPNGYSFLYDVETDEDPANSFYLDYSIVDSRNILKDPTGLHLRLTMLSTEEEPFTEVTLAKGCPPAKSENPEYYPYSLVRKDGGDNLFTAVYEPYRHVRYLSSMELVDVTVVEGEFQADDRAAAVKVLRADGKVEYIVYCTNYDAVVRVDDRFDFRGFVGVVTYESTAADANICYRYGMDATQVAGDLQEYGAVSGKVVDFTRELGYENSLTVQLDQSIDPKQLIGRVIYVENDGEENGAYLIEGAKADGGNVTLDLGDQSMIRTMKEPTDLSAGYLYNIAVGQSCRIPMSACSDTMSFLNYQGDQVVRSGYKISLTTGVAGSGMTYTAEGLATNMKFNASTGLLTWTPAKTQVGRYPITVSAVDANGVTVGKTSFVIYVVAYTGANYDPAVCTHSKAVTYTVDNVEETVCPACKTVTRTVMEEPEEVIETFNVAGTNMNLGNELAVNFMFTKALDENHTYTAVITQTCQGKVVKTTEIPQAQWASFSSALYKVTASVRAMEMADELTLEVKDENGNVHNNEYVTSVRAYSMKALAASSSSEEMKQLVVDMLNYGTQAQIKFGYNTTDYANNLLSEAQKELASDPVVCTDERVKGTNYYGSNLALEDRIELNLFFKNVTTDMYAVVSYTNFKGSTVSYTVKGTDFGHYSGNIYKVPVDSIVVPDARCLVTITVYNADGTVHGSGADSVASYAARAGENALNDAIMKFASSAKNYLT